MTLNPDVVRTRCGDIEEACGRLARFAAMPMGTFVADSDAVDAPVTGCLSGWRPRSRCVTTCRRNTFGRFPEQYARVSTRFEMQALSIRRSPSG